MRLMDSTGGCAFVMSRSGRLRRRRQFQGGGVGERKRARKGEKFTPRVVFGVSRMGMRCTRGAEVKSGMGSTGVGERRQTFSSARQDFTTEHASPEMEPVGHVTGSGQSDGSAVFTAKRRPLPALKRFSACVCWLALGHRHWARLTLDVGRRQSRPATTSDRNLGIPPTLTLTRALILRGSCFFSSCSSPYHARLLPRGHMLDDTSLSSSCVGSACASEKSPAVPSVRKAAGFGRIQSHSSGLRL
jgi:hypothetical protein